MSCPLPGPRRRRDNKKRKAGGKQQNDWEKKRVWSSSSVLPLSRTIAAEKIGSDWGIGGGFQTTTGQLDVALSNGNVGGLCRQNHHTAMLQNDPPSAAAKDGHSAAAAPHRTRPKAATSSQTGELPNAYWARWIAGPGWLAGLGFKGCRLGLDFFCEKLDWGLPGNHSNHFRDWLPATDTGYVQGTARPPWLKHWRYVPLPVLLQSRTVVETASFRHCEGPFRQGKQDAPSATWIDAFCRRNRRIASVRQRHPREPHLPVVSCLVAAALIRLNVWALDEAATCSDAFFGLSSASPTQPVFPGSCSIHAPRSVSSRISNFDVMLPSC
ncbi:hypothetical protein CDEST_02748 [Colletotrichum destructivum]|uniref:Uncharacterized protein n=1 Tax=Colletotrichum destructivum TaxID=34406 RepID=A0AAX4I2Y5_9PEZI|nr:hypothetical protein CDEST_02748 [Colletotrichum destructivum]